MKIMSVLLVEDHPMIQRLHRSMLTSLGYRVDVAENGAKALKLFNKKHRLVFLDLGLPDQSGIQVAIEMRRRELKANRKPVPIIVATAFANDELEEKCKQAGANEFLTKPLSQEKISRVLNRWLVPKKKGLARYYLNKNQTTYLSQREAECVVLFLEQYKDAEAAEVLGISERTVEYYVQRIKEKLGCYHKRQIAPLIKTSVFMEHVAAIKIKLAL